MQRARYIFLDVEIDDLDTASRAVRWLIETKSGNTSGIICYGEGQHEKCFYVQQNKSSITVRPLC